MHIKSKNDIKLSDNTSVHEDKKGHFNSVHRFKGQIITAESQDVQQTKHDDADQKQNELGKLHLRCNDKIKKGLFHE